MPNILSNLEISEISLVDSPACSTIDPRTKKKTRHATVALFKRDGDVPRTNQFKNQEQPMEFETILKSATSRETIAEAVTKRAGEIAREKGISPEAAEAEIWKRHPTAHAAYDAAPKQLHPRRPARQMCNNVTEAEIELDSMARKIMKRDGLSYPAACSKYLTQHPECYTAYCAQREAGQVFAAPDPSRSDVEVDYFCKRAAESEASSVCANCDSQTDSSDSFCSSCGEDLTAQRETAKSKSKAKAKSKF